MGVVFLTLVQILSRPPYNCQPRGVAKIFQWSGRCVDDCWRIVWISNRSSQVLGWWPINQSPCGVGQCLFAHLNRSGGQR